MLRKKSLFVYLFVYSFGLLKKKTMLVVYRVFFYLVCVYVLFSFLCVCVHVLKQKDEKKTVDLDK